MGRVMWMLEWDFHLATSHLPMENSFSYLVTIEEAYFICF